MRPEGTDIGVGVGRGKSRHVVHIVQGWTTR